MSQNTQDRLGKLVADLQQLRVRIELRRAEVYWSVRRVSRSRRQSRVFRDRLFRSRQLRIHREADSDKPPHVSAYLAPLVSRDYCPEPKAR